jgi:hypothetical protein
VTLRRVTKTAGGPVRHRICWLLLPTNLLPLPGKEEGGAGAGVSQTDVISCTITVGNPIKLTLASTQVEATTFTSCTKPVSSIRHTGNLFLIVPPVVLLTDSRTRLGNRSVTAVPAAPCANGTWAANADSFIVAPPGYNPPDGRLFASSAAAPITC